MQRSDEPEEECKDGEDKGARIVTREERKGVSGEQVQGAGAKAGGGGRRKLLRANAKEDFE